MISAPSSSINSTDGSSDDYDDDTPATSAAVTPSYAIDSKQANRFPTSSRIGASARALELRNAANAFSAPRAESKKRRASGKVADDLSDEEDADTKLARKLQAEEYGEIDTENNIKSAKRRKGSGGHSLSSILVDDSESEDQPIVARRRFAAAKPPATKCTMSKRAEVGESDTSELSALVSSDEESDFTDDVSSMFSADSDVSLTDAATTTANAVSHVTNALTHADTSSRITRRPTRPSRRLRHPAIDTFGFDRSKRRAVRERRKLEGAHPEIKTMWDDLKDVEIIKPMPTEQPQTISRKLKSFQLEGLNWMVRQEKSQWKGGLLGDEMGMGKTIQAVSLIMSDYPAKKPTLVVVPPVALMQWQAEISDYTNGKLRVLVFHISANPKCKLLSVKDLKKYDVIMVSYSGLESMHRKENKGWNRKDGLVKEDSILHAIDFHRLILDEAHSIKQRTTSVAKACFALTADYKWCLSGTPVQNRIGEFFSLLRFLEVQPFACYFCKECDCKELHWSQNENKMCTHCHHSGFNHVSVFNQELLNPITQGEDPELRKQGLAKLRLITDRIMLRRMKRDYTSSMELPPKDVIIHNEFFGEIERDFSQSIMSNTQRKFDTYVAQGVMLNNYANIFGLIMQMRQVANHPDLILRKHAEGGQNILVCSICDEPAEEAIRSRCRHEFCRQCAKNYVRSCEGLEGNADCPRCHIPLVIDWDQPDIEQDEENVKKSSIINRIKMEDWTSSTKIEMLVYDLYKLRSKKQTHKSIVFSQFTSMLQLVQWRLQKSGFSTVLLDGSMSPTQRQKSIEHFMTNVDCEVFLVSLKAGGVALNLTEASRVFIIDP